MEVNTADLKPATPPSKILTVNTSDLKPVDGDSGSSVFDKPSTPTPAADIPARIKQLGKAGLTAASGAITAQTGTEAGAELGGVVGGPAGAAVGGLIGSAVGGAASPVVEAATAKHVLGENVVQPSAGEILSSAGLNLGFHTLGEIGGARAENLRAAGARDLPIEQTNPTQVKQLVKNKDFLRSIGVPEEQIDSIASRPDAGALLQRQVSAGKQAKAAFNTIADTTREDFKQQYQAALGPHANASTGVQDIAGAMGKLSQGTESGQHELTPSFRGFLARKADELQKTETPADPLLQDYSPSDIKKMSPTEQAGLRKMYGNEIGKPQQVVGVPAPKAMDLQGIRDLKTELGENLPAQATPLDRKAYAQVQQLLSKRQDEMLAQSGATPEQIGQVHALDEKWGQFQTTLKQLRPDSQTFGADVGKTLWSDAAKNPTNALHMIDMAQAAEKARPGEVMPQLRESFLTNLQAQAREGQVAGGPVQEMKVLRKVQDQWRGTKEGQAVLDGMFGQDSPMSDPTKISQVLGRMDDPAARNKFTTMMQGAGPGGYLVRAAALAAVAGGSIYSIANHPERAVPIAATLLTLGVAGPLLARMTPTAQRAYVKFIMTPNPATLRSLTNVAGATVTGIQGQPETKP